MLKLILYIVISILATALVVSLFFYFKIYRRWIRFIAEENRKLDIELKYAQSELREEEKLENGKRE